MDRSADAVWNGAIRDGKGMISTASGALKELPYSFSTRFETAPGTNPEELVAAAHAGCFSMALSKELADSGMTPSSIHTRATVSIEQQGGGFAVTKVRLELEASYSGGDEQSFRQAAEAAKEGCPISKLLNAPIDLTIRS